jgi:integrase
LVSAVIVALIGGTATVLAAAIGSRNCDCQRAGGDGADIKARDCRLPRAHLLHTSPELGSLRAEVIEELGREAGLGKDGGDAFGPHVLRHTFGTQLVRSGIDLVTVAELMRHARLDTTRIYTLPTRADRERALKALVTDG